MDMNRILVFALFWIAVGMLLMIFIRYRIIGIILSLALFVICFFLRHNCR